MNLLDEWIQVACTVGEEWKLEPIRTGVYLNDPFCCSLLKDPELVQRLDLTKEEALMHLHTAWEAGYQVDQALLDLRNQNRDVYTEGYLLRSQRSYEEKRKRIQNWMNQVNAVLGE